VGSASELGIERKFIVRREPILNLTQRSVLPRAAKRTGFVRYGFNVQRNDLQFGNLLEPEGIQGTGLTAKVNGCKHAPSREEQKQTREGGEKWSVEQKVCGWQLFIL
jgi:hypothetical protein